MSFRSRAEHAAGVIGGLIDIDPDSDQSKAIADAVEKEIIEESERCLKVAHQCCSPDLDKAHKIAEGIKRTHTALVANLSSLR